MRTIITIQFILLFSVISFSQITTSKPSEASILEISEKKRVVLKPTYTYGTIGTFGNVLAASANVEYHLINTKYVKLGPKLSLGAFAAGDFDGGGTTEAFLRPSFCLLVGVDRIENSKSSYFLEINYWNFQDKDKRINIGDPIYLFAGIRKVENDNKFWRLGFGIPEVIQFSYGINF